MRTNCLPRARRRNCLRWGPRWNCWVAITGFILKSIEPVTLTLADEVGATGWYLRAALSLARLQRNAGREREAVVGEGPAAGRAHDPLRAVDVGGNVTDNFDPEPLQAHILVAERIERPQTAKIEVREER